MILIQLPEIISRNADVVQVVHRKGVVKVSLLQRKQLKVSLEMTTAKALELAQKIQEAIK